jgi:hypothetical protein
LPESAAKPIAAFVCIHASDAPDGLLPHPVKTGSPGQILSEEILVTVGFGRTVIEKLVELVQPFGDVATTVIVPKMLEVVVLVAVKLAICAVPDAARPMLAFVFDQEKVVPARFVFTKSSGLTKSPGQTVKLAGVFTVGRGFIVIVKFWLGPGQVVKVGVTVKLETMSVDVKFVGAVYVGIWPEPVVANIPMAILLFVHIKLPPLGELTKSVTST